MMKLCLLEKISIFGHLIYCLSVEITFGNASLKPRNHKLGHLIGFKGSSFVFRE